MGLHGAAAHGVCDSEDLFDRGWSGGFGGVVREVGTPAGEGSCGNAGAKRGPKPGSRSRRVAARRWGLGSGPVLWVTEWAASAATSLCT